MDILGIETSCDETSAAVVRDGREVISNVVYTQIPRHRPSLKSPRGRTWRRFIKLSQMLSAAER